MRERLLAELDARIARHAAGDPSAVLDDRALSLVAELTTTGDPDAGSLTRVAALHLCRARSLPPELAEDDHRLARALYTRLHAVDPRLVPPDVRAHLGLPSPHDSGIALMREYERTGDLAHLDRAISLFRQELLEQHPGSAHTLATALRHRYEHTGHRPDLNEALHLGGH